MRGKKKINKLHKNEKRSNQNKYIKKQITYVFLQNMIKMFIINCQFGSVVYFCSKGKKIKSKVSSSQE